MTTKKAANTRQRDRAMRRQVRGVKQVVVSTDPHDNKQKHNHKMIPTSVTIFMSEASSTNAETTFFCVKSNLNLTTKVMNRH